MGIVATPHPTGTNAFPDGAPGPTGRHVTRDRDGRGTREPTARGPDDGVRPFGTCRPEGGAS